MPSNLGGKQLHYARNGGAQDFEYTFEAPRAGTYELTARVVTPSWRQSPLSRERLEAAHLRKRKNPYCLSH